MAKVNYTKTDKRLKILEAGEIDVIYGLPIFNEEEQEQYFSLSPSEEAIYQQFRSVVSRLYFILQLGYFKSRHQFFIFNFQDVVSDASYVQHRYLPNFSLASVEISKSTRLKQQQLILTLFNYRYCEATDRQKLRVKAQQVVKVDSQPIYIFRELMRYLAEQSLIAPGYSFMQDLIGNALKQEQARLITIATNHLSQADRLPLNKLLTNPDGLYELTRLKREPKDFSHKEISQEIKWSEQITDLYGVAQKLLFHLAISNESIKYYATLVSYYSVYQLNQLDEQLISIYLLCFIYHRYQKLHDNLIHCFIYHTRRYLEESKQVAKERVYAYRLEHNANLSKAGQVLQLFTDDTIVGTTPFKLVRDQAFAILEPLQLEKMATYIVQKTHFDETLFQWEHIEIMARRFKRRLRPLLKAIDFRASAIHEPLLAAIYFLRMTWQKENTRHQHNSGERPMHFIPNSIKRYLYVIDKEGHKLLHPDRYEFLVYRSLRNSLEAGHVFCQDSIHFRSFENDLVDDVHWQEKETLFANLALPMLNITATEQLSMLKQQLEERLQSVNQRIVTGENEYVQVKTRAHSVRWTLPYSSTHETANHPFFEILPQINIQTILHFVNQQCFFMSAFTHVLHRYTKQTHDDRVIIAGLLAWGTNMGLGRMGQISDISYQALAATSGNFIRLETLQKANDIVSNAVASLPIFKQFSIGNTLHSSSDGQKFETLLHTLNARHSPKYFGLQKGVVAYTLIANHIPINAKIIGADEHESHFVFDILHNNHTEVQPTIHSTDTHGTNEVNFAILSFFDYQFAPRYRDIYDKIRTSLYGFHHPSHYPTAWLLKPIRKINETLIIDEWENIQRIILSLALKTTTQSIIIGKLSTYARKNKTRRALWEYDNIIRSLYLLDYVDSLPLRRNVQQALNRGENYHQLRQAVSYANFGKLRFKTETEQQIWNECSRLITNCIIFYNAFVLSHLLVIKEAEQDSQQAFLFRSVSPVAWQHINFYGRYEFTKLSEPLDIRAIIQELVTALPTSIPLSGF